MLRHAAKIPFDMKKNIVMKKGTKRRKSYTCVDKDCATDLCVPISGI